MQRKRTKPNPYRGNSAEEVLANLEKVKMDRSDRIKDAENYHPSINGLIQLFKDVYVEEYPIMCPFLGFSQADVGKLKHVSAAMQEQGVNPLTYFHKALTNWNAYTSHCEDAHSAFNCPAVPNVGFIVKYAQGLVSFFNAERVDDPEITFSRDWGE